MRSSAVTTAASKTVWEKRKRCSSFCGKNRAERVKVQRRRELGTGWDVAGTVRFGYTCFEIERHRQHKVPLVFLLDKRRCGCL